MREARLCAKLSSSTVSTRRLWTIQLYPNIDGMATSRPATVVMSAAATPGAIAPRSARFPAWAAIATPPKASITPHTVPRRPRNGAPLTAAASSTRPDSSFRASRETAPSSERFTCSMVLTDALALRAPSG